MSGAHVISIKEINQLKMTDKWQPIRNKRQTVYRTHYMPIKGRNSLDSSFWTSWLFCIALVKASEGQTQFWVLFCSWVLLIWVWSLAEARLRTAWAVSRGPGVSSCSWHVAGLVPGDWEYLFSLIRQKQNLGGASIGHLYICINTAC